MGNLNEVLLITLFTTVISAAITYMYKVRKHTRKDYKQSDYAKTKRPDITIGL